MTSPSFVPLALFTSLTLAVLMLATIWSCEAENAAAARRERAALRAAITVERNALVSQVAHLTRLDTGAEGTAAAEFESALRAPIAFDNIFVVDLNTGAALQDDRWRGDRYEALRPALLPVLARYQERERQLLRGSLTNESNVPSVSPASTREGESFFVREGDRIDAVAIVPPPAGASRASAAMVGVASLDGMFLSRLIRKAGVGPIDVVANGADPGMRAVIDLTDVKGQSLAGLAWTPSQPGNERALWFAAILVFFAALFAALVVYHSRRVARVLVESEARAQQLAGQDLLSGLPNRALFNQYLDAEIGRTQRTGSAFALFYLDLDRFKEINDSFGHDAGDRLIQASTQRVSTILRGGDRIARLGGDEFAILQTEVRSPRDCEKLAKRILQEMAQPFDLGDQKVFAAMSIGIALHPHDAQDSNELMRRADLALYRAKNEGRNRFCFFEQRMGEELRMRKTVEDELRAAIDRDELIAQYQPILSADGEKLVGVEALVRWRHPVHGLISPERFVGLAEDSGLILPLGEWMLRRACSDARRWPNLYVAVNVSPIQFRNSAFPTAVERILKETGMEPSRLELELTEGVLIKDADQAENAIIELRAKGVRLALDDFGIGYSSLIYLRRFAFDKIKIDKSFLQSMEMTGESAIILHSIVHLGRALGLTVTAEGIENEDQQRFLQALGCHELQGFLYSQPVDADELTALVGRGGAGVSGQAVCEI
ncbi:MAG: EAL domain-containing protein, partial [Methylobacteriaceae bacterium]|nr:EAL domain-containing protein [Methylobacteriaceae bacterium]